MTIERRLEILERRCRRLTAALTGLTLLATSVLMMGAGEAVPEVIRAKAFEVIGSSGESRVKLYTLDDRGLITTLGPGGHALVDIGATVTGTGSLRTYDGEGRPLVSIGATPKEEGTVNTYNAKGDNLIKLGVTADGQGAIGAFRRAGGVRAMWP
ncbi:MAG: hypothetical protein E4H03_00235 [Myxococcales bacterium]|jgi:hypothetical protein|nr:MAG: hypothetical protein E4H03_00235 [Myxococcales bacterium]